MRTLDELIAVRKTALVVYDMQVGILHQVADGAEVLEKVGRLLAAARQAGIPVFFMRHLSLPKPLMGNFAVRQAMIWQRTDDPEAVSPWFLRESPGFQIAPELAPRPDEAIIDKITMSAFEGTYLGIAMRDLGMEAFIVAGIALEIGIEPTIRQASDLGLISILPVDACGAGHKEAGERATESIRFMGDAIVTDLATVIEKLGGPNAVS